MTIDADSDAFRIRPEFGVRVTRTAHDTHRIELWGAMPVGWLGNFTRAASRLSLDIMRGVARRGAFNRWSAEFEVSSTVHHDLEQIDFLALARDASSASSTSEPELRRFELSRSSERPGALTLSVRAKDCVGPGFLARASGGSGALPGRDRDRHLRR